MIDVFWKPTYCQNLKQKTITDKSVILLLHDTARFYHSSNKIKNRNQENRHLFTIVKNGVIVNISVLLQNTLAIFQMAH